MMVLFQLTALAVLYVQQVDGYTAVDPVASIQSNSRYTVQKGDTVASIASKTNVDAGNIERWNDIEDPDDLSLWVHDQIWLEKPPPVDMMIMEKAHMVKGEFQASLIKQQRQEMPHGNTENLMNRQVMKHDSRAMPEKNEEDEIVANGGHVPQMIQAETMPAQPAQREQHVLTGSSSSMMGNTVTEIMTSEGDGMAGMGSSADGMPERSEGRDELTDDGDD